MQLQFNDHIALELVPCEPLRNTGYKREESEWCWARVVGVTVPVRRNGGKSCFAAKIPNGKHELVGRFDDSAANSIRGLDTPFVLYVLWRETLLGRTIVAIRAYRNLQFDPVKGDCGDLVFDTFEMTNRDAYGPLALEKLELYYHHTRSEFESFVRKVYLRRATQLAGVIHDLRVRVCNVELELERAGLAVTKETSLNTEELRRDGSSQYQIGRVAIDTKVVSALPEFPDSARCSRSLIFGALFDSEGQLVVPTELSKSTHSQNE